MSERATGGLGKDHERAEQIAELAAHGLVAVEIARSMGLPRLQVMRIAKRFGVQLPRIRRPADTPDRPPPREPRRRPEPVPDIAARNRKIVAEKRLGRSLNALARAYGLTKMRISQIVRGHPQVEARQAGSLGLSPKTADVVRRLLRVEANAPLTVEHLRAVDVHRLRLQKGAGPAVVSEVRRVAAEHGVEIP